MQRRGLMVGSGKRGYYNVMGKDPMVHAQSARGMKQPQRMPFYSINPAQAKYQPEKLAVGAVSEANEHRWATPQQATRIAKDHLLENPKYYGKYDEVGNIIAYEQGELDDKNTLKLFSHLIKNGHAWSLQGSYGRTAAALIADGWIDKQGNITKKAKENDLGGKVDWAETGQEAASAGIGLVRGAGDVVSGAGEAIGGIKSLAEARRLGKEKEYIEAIEHLEKVRHLNAEREAGNITEDEYKHEMDKLTPILEGGNLKVIR